MRIPTLFAAPLFVFLFAKPILAVDNPRPIPPAKDVDQADDLRRSVRRVSENVLPRAGGDELFYRDIKNERIGIGTTTPSLKLDVVGSIGGSAVYIGTNSFALSGKLFSTGGRSFFEANSEEYAIGVRYSGANGSGGNFYIGASNSSTPDLVLSNNSGTAQVRVRGAGGLSVLNDMSSGSPVTNTLYKSTIVKGWIRMDGTGTISITDSFNVSGITDNATGNYTVTWDTDFANANYAVTATASTQAGFNVACANNYVAGSVQIRTTRSSTEADSDVAQLSVIAIGDQ